MHKIAICLSVSLDTTAMAFLPHNFSSKERAPPTVPKFQIIESTLREGEQFFTAFFSPEMKLRIAMELDQFRVDYIEVTNPAASEQSRLDCEAICRLGLKNSKVLAHIRCHMDDARIAIATGVHGVNVLIGTSPQLREHSHGKTMPEITEMALGVISYLLSSGLEVRFSAEDAFRSNQDDLFTLYSMVDKLGVHRVGVADTVGCATPSQVSSFIGRLRSRVKCDIETHFHNDTGCAVANSFSAVEAGATLIDTTVLGIGERNGITSLGGIMARMIVTNRDYVLSKYRVENLVRIENLVAEASNIGIPFNNMITGSSAFSHKAGIHTKAVLSDPSSYEVLRPDDFGISRAIQYGSRLTGWNAIKSRGLQLGLEMTDAQYKACTAIVKAAGDKGISNAEEVDRIIRRFQREEINERTAPPREPDLRLARRVLSARPVLGPRTASQGNSRSLYGLYTSRVAT
ncbi:hypothetical protein O988_05480 [Pseudogymnoascus sp. VKM F-3808]|nr:hypothetical protein O988_05480 [Pseudogymnoascus sp. VKM F-3808]